MAKLESMYDVVWYVNGFPKETIAYNKPRAVANWLKRKAETTTHKGVGKVILVNNTLKSLSK